MLTPLFGDEITTATVNSILFFGSLTLEVLFGSVILLYASHSFLLVVADTSAGNDEVFWPDEFLTDWIGKPIYLVWLAAIWLVPTWLLLRQAESPGLADYPWLITLIYLVVFWLFFPISVLSSLSVAMFWVVVHPGYLWQLAKRRRELGYFYAVSGLVLGGCTALVVATVFVGWIWLLPVMAPAVAAGWLIYARLLGRLAWVLNPREPPPPKPAPPRRRPRYVEGSPGDEQREEADAGPDASRVEPVTGRFPLNFAQRQARRLQPVPPPPAKPLVSGVYSFPWYGTSLRAWLALTLGALILGGLGHLMLVYWPKGEATSALRPGMPTVHWSWSCGSAGKPGNFHQGGNSAWMRRANREWSWSTTG